MNNIGPLTEEYYTRSFSKDGWQGTFTFDPEDMIAMEAFMYSFKHGQLYRHSAGSDRNTFYGVQSPSTITGVINQSPTDNKVFKTFNMEGTLPWDAEFETNKNTGLIDSTWFQDREGEYFAHIRNNEGDVDIDLRSAQGIGEVLGVAASGGGMTLTFDFMLDMQPPIGSKIYRPSGGGPALVGTVSATGPTSITVSAPYNVVSPGTFLLFVRDSQAESYGMLGYYMRYVLSLDTNVAAELFSVAADAFKSYP